MTSDNVPTSKNMKVSDANIGTYVLRRTLQTTSYFIYLKKYNNFKEQLVIFVLKTFRLLKFFNQE